MFHFLYPIYTNNMAYVQVPTRISAHLQATLVTNGYSFKVWVKKTENIHGMVFSVNVGPSWENACVEVSIIAPGGFLPSDTAHLTRVKYQPCCSCDRLLAKGGGSNIMVRETLKYVSKKYDWVKYFKLDDTSTVQCLDGAKHTVSLAALMISYSGQTWYERDFGATLKHDHDEYRMYINKALNGKHLSFDEFAEANGLPEQQHELFRGFYDRALTLQSFFTDIKAAYPCDHPNHSFCTLVAPWLDSVVRHATNNMHVGEWIIPVTQIDKWGQQVGDCVHGATFETVFGAVVSEQHSKA